MTRKYLTTSSLLAAALALPVFAQDADAPAPAERTEHNVVVVQNAQGERHVVVVQGDAVQGQDNVTLEVEVHQEGGVDGADGGDVTTRIVMMDEDGNIIQLEDGALIEWVQGDNLNVELAELGVPGATLREGEDGKIQVFLRQIGQPDVVDWAPVNPPMVEATYLGLNCEPLDFDTAALLLVDEGTGLNVTYVAEDSPAAAAGLEVGDTLLEMGDQILVNPEQLAVLIRTHDAGDTVSLLVVRDGEEFELTAELGTNTVPQLGPGGRNLNQFWNVQRHGNAGDMRFVPEVQGRWIAELAQVNPDMEGVQEQIEMIQLMLAEQMQEMHGIELLREHTQQMREQMRGHEEAIRLMLEQIHGEMGDLDQLHDMDLHFDHDAAMNIVWNDGEHTITIHRDGEGEQTLNIVDAEGNEVYDGIMPEGDALDELPEEVREKLLEMQDVGELELEWAPEAPEAPVAPEAPEADF